MCIIIHYQCILFNTILITSDYLFVFFFQIAYFFTCNLIINVVYYVQAHMKLVLTHMHTIKTLDFRRH